MINIQNKTLLLATIVFCTSAQSATVNQVIQEGTKRVTENARSQHNIDKIADITERNHADYRQTTQSLDNLKVYNKLLQKQVDNQQQRMASLRVSLDNTAQMQRDIMPLVEEMVQNLGDFIGLDMPFLLNERKTRVAQLKILLDQSNIDIAEKFRQVTETYQVEMDYGRTIESFRDTLLIDNTERELNLLRVGRIALMYRSEDGKHLGHWNKNKQQWQALDASQYDRSIKNGIAIALKQKAPSLITIPVTADNKPTQGAAQ